MSCSASSRQQPRPRRITRAASRAAAAALLSDSPGEVVAHILKQCEPRDFGALACTAQWLHPLLELALRLRAGENGHALPKKLPLGDDSCHRRVQVLLSLERRRAQLGRRTIAAGMSHSLFISPEGTLLSCGTEWDVDGNPTPGLLGHGELAEEELPANSIHVPTPLPGLASVRIRSVAAGVSLSLAVTSEGEVYSWGQGNMGQLGHGTWASSQSTPRQITALASERVVAVEAGFIHALALAESGAVYSWGAGGDGRLGHGSEEHLSTPRRIEALAGRHVRAVAAGYESSLALTADGAVLSWGRGALGQLGHGGNPTPRSEPLPHVIDAFRGTPIAAVTAGNKRSLALSRSGGVYSWGDGAGGQLGHGDETHEDAPKLVSALARLDVAMVVAGASHSFALTADGALYSWGAGQCGRLGHGDEAKQLLPKRVDGLSSVKVVSVSGGAFHSLAADERGNVYGWGDGDGASLGLQLTQDQLEPRQYPNGLQAAR